MQTFRLLEKATPALPLMSCVHVQRISLGIVRAEARAYLDALARRKSDLVRIIGVMRAHS